MHWICAVVFMQEKRIQVYDSMGGGEEYLPHLMQYLKDEHKDKKKCPLPDADSWTLVSTTVDTPRQRNGKNYSYPFALFLVTSFAHGHPSSPTHSFTLF